MLFLLLLLLIGVALLIVQTHRLTLASRRLQAPSLERSLFSLQPGDIVQAMTRDWVVEDRLIYEDDGFQWLEYLLRDGADLRCLVVCEDDLLEVGWLEPVLWEPPRPLPRRLQWEGQTFVLEEEGRARVSADQRTMNRSPGSCRYLDYRGAGRRILSVELWGENRGDPEQAQIEVWAGESIEPLSLTLLPGDGRRVYR